jgi:phosphoenolpyruvate phosphomutase
MLRAAYPSMMNVAESILTHKRSKEADDHLLPVKEIITLIDDNTGL